MTRRSLPFAALACFAIVAAALPSLATAAGPASTRISGAVLKADGTPVAGALVVARPAELPKPPEGEATGDATPKPARLPETKTGADGRFALEVPGTPPVALRVEAAGFAPATRRDLSGDQPVTVTLEAGLALSGQIFDRRTGRPLAKAEVEAAGSDASGFFDPDDAKRFRAKATADAQGRFRLAGLAPDLYSVSASAPGFRAASRDRVGVGLGAAPADVFLYLKPGVTIPGRVVDREGKPIAKASVSVRPSGGLPSNLADWTGGGGDLYARTDDKGAFELAGVPAAQAFLLEVTHEDYAPAWLDGVRATDGRRTAPATITLDRGVTLTGKLLAGDQPFDGRLSVELSYETPDDWAGNRRTVRRSGPKVVAKEGAFRIERLPTGTATVEVEPNGYAPVKKDKVLVQAEHGADVGTLTVERGAAISGTVVDEAGKPVAEAEVATQSLSMTGGFVRRECTTGADGAFALAGLPADRTYEVTASHAGFASASQKELKPDGDALTLTLRAKGSGTVTGRVVTGNPPVPVAGLFVEAIPKGDSSPMGMMTALGMGVEKRAVHAADGRFQLEDLVPGKYTFKVTADGLVPARLEETELFPGQPLDLGEIRLEKGATVRGLVQDKGSKAPVGGAAIVIEEGGGLAGMLKQMDPNQRPAATTGPDGRFTLSGIAPGQLALRVESDRYAPAKSTLEIQPGVPPADLTVDLGPGGTIEGIVRDKSGLPQPNYMITATTGFGANLRMITSTDEVGHYKLETIPPGDYMVVSMPTPRGGGDEDGAAQAEMMSKMQMQSVKVEEARTSVLNFPAGGGAAITVKGVVRRGGSPVESRVFFVKTDATNTVQDLASTQTGPDGSFEVRLAGAGEYRAAVMPVASKPGDVGTSVRFTVPDGKAAVDQDLVLSEAEVSGQVTDLDSGQPLKGARIVAVQLDADGEVDERTSSTGSATTGEDGRFVVEGLEPGEWRLSVLHEGHGSETIGPLTIKPDAKLEGRNAGLRPARPMIFSIKDELGQPVEGAMVLRLELGTAGAGIGMDLGSDVDGRAQVRNLADGTYDLAVVATGFALKVLPGVPVGESSPREVAVTLQRAQPVTVKVVDSSGKGVSGLMVGVKDSTGLDLSSMLILQRIFSQEGFSLGTDAGGTAKLSGLEPGKYELTFRRGTDVVTRQSFKVKAGEPTAVEVKLP
ncbi:MAG: carboxypeptidase-like regulatory domain-containing protein [Acidobacteria bacterium]|jgi:protocatechuate 3,4-dioxygenase beta subunit|nr:carboxypeptidase-like regulatory domain-containing protein [Acidobacteriota bacterium]